MPVMGYGTAIKLVRTQLKRRLIASWSDMFQKHQQFRFYSTKKLAKGGLITKAEFLEKIKAERATYQAMFRQKGN